MNIEVRQLDNAVILDLDGNINIDSADLIETIGWVILNKSKNVICNFSKVNVVDYTGISVIAVAYKDVLNHDGRMKICQVPAHLQKLFGVVGLDKVFEYYPTEQAALDSFSQTDEIAKVLREQLRRRFKRLPLRGDAEFCLAQAKQKKYFQGTFLNISAIGMFIVSEKIFPIGELLLARVYLLPKPGILELLIRVKWVENSVIDSVESLGMGVEFVDISPQTQEKILEFVEHNLGSSE